MLLPQRIAAVLDLIPKELKDAAPGHRFQLYLEHWQGANGNTFDPYKKLRPQGKDERAVFDRECAGVLKDLCALPPSSVAALKAIRNRQQTLLKDYGDAGYRISSTSTAPFATGLGNEHPIENGFAFLTPYGLPYLAGSGVKGILRRAAEELALENDKQGAEGWTWLAIWFLFGFEGAVDEGSLWDGSSQFGAAFLRDVGGISESPEIYTLLNRLFDKDKNAGARYLDVESRGAAQFLQACIEGKSLRGGLQNRGALDFWDVFPWPFADKLVVEIMTPHFGSYYQGKSTPHDSGAPTPVSFLAVPAKSDFDFHVVCHPSRLPASLQNTWRDLLQKAFDHAFEWVGFGAKTSVGYGAMAEDPKAKKQRDDDRLAAQDAARKALAKIQRDADNAKLSPAMRAKQEFLDARADKNQPELSALLGGLKKGVWGSDAKLEIAQFVKQLMVKDKKWKEISEKKNPARDNDHQDTLVIMKCLSS